MASALRELRHVRMPVLFVSIGDPLHSLDTDMPATRLLRKLGASIAATHSELRAIVCLSPKCTATPSQITGSGAPPCISPRSAGDFSAFHYAVKGLPKLAERVRYLFDRCGISCEVDSSRGVDVGTWLPVWLLFEQPPVPVVEVSLDAGNLTPEFYLAVGEALWPLREQGVLLVFAGGATHNLEELAHSVSISGLTYDQLSGVSEAARIRRRRAAQAAPVPPWSSGFDEWLTASLAPGAWRRNCAECKAELLRFKRATPHAARAHPNYTHYLPLVAAAGACTAGDACIKIIDGVYQHGLSRSSWLWVDAMDSQLLEALQSVLEAADAEERAGKELQAGAQSARIRFSLSLRPPDG